MEKIAYIGVDVHKDTNSAFMFYRDDRGNPSYYEIGTIAAGSVPMMKAIRKALSNCNLDPGFEVLVGYEAGPTGYGLCKSLQGHGYHCVIMAPTTIKKAPGERIKTVLSPFEKRNKTVVDGGTRPKSMEELGSCKLQNPRKTVVYSGRPRRRSGPFISSREAF